MDTLEVLLKARDEIAKGWCKNTLEDGDGNVCAIGACVRVSGCGEQSKIVNACFRALCDQVPAQILVRSFNDDLETSQADVIALFSRAINAEAAKVAAPVDPAHAFPQAA